MAKRKANPEAIIQIEQPLSGIEETRAYAKQRSGTTAQALNVRAFDPGTDRARIGARSGQVKFLNQQINGSASIQLIDHLDTVSSAPSWTFNPFVYANASNGFGIGNDFSGASLFTGIGNTRPFNCSCWDTLGNLYVGQGSATNTALVVCVNPATGAVTWTSATLSVANAASRQIVGMAVCGLYLYVAYIANTTQGAGAAKIAQINVITGTITNAAWLTSIAPAAGNSGGNVSNNSSNCLAAIGTTLGFVSYGSATTANFFTYNAAPGSTSTAIGSVVLASASAVQNICKVVTDGTANFYVLTPAGTSMLAKIPVGVALAGSATWTSPVADTCNSIAYDTSTSTLLALCQTAPSIRQVNVASGVLVANVSTDNVIWNEVGADQLGNFVLWQNAVASNDVKAINNSLASRFGPVTLANTAHTGASVSPIPAPVAASGARLTLGLAIAGGTLKNFTSTAVGAITGGAVFSSSASVIRGCQSGIRYFFTDGTAYKYYDPKTSSVLPWTAQDGGTMPLDLGGNTLPLIASWRGRIVLAGQTVWAMSALNDPFNWNFAPFIPNTTQATFGTVDALGYPGQTINSLLSYDDNATLIFGLSHSLYQLSGDPEANGQFNIAMREVGMPYGTPWCIDPFGQIYFWGNGFGVFTMVPGSLPVPISMQIDRRIQNVNLSAAYVRMEWDLFNQGLAIFITPLGSAVPTVNFFWEKRTNAWWIDAYNNTNLNPLALHAYRRGPLASDQQIFLGGRDGYIRVLGNGNSTDDGNNIASSVMLGPVPNKEEERLLLLDLLSTLSDGSGAVTYSVYVGETAEEALASQAVATGTWNPGRNPVSFTRWSGVAIYVKVSATGPWAIEKLMARVTSMGPAASRLYLGNQPSNQLGYMTGTGTLVAQSIVSSGSSYVTVTGSGAPVVGAMTASGAGNTPFAQTGNSGSGTASSFSATWPVATTAGNILVVAVRVASSTQLPSTPAGWTSDIARTNNSGVNAAIFSKISAGESSVSITLSGSASFSWATAEVVIGVYSGTPDLSSSSAGLGTVAGTNSGTTVAANEICFAAFGSISNTVATPTNSFLQVPGSTSMTNGLFAYRVLTSTGTISCTATVGATDQWVGVLTSFR